MHSDGLKHDIRYFDSEIEFTEIEVTESTYSQFSYLYVYVDGVNVTSGAKKIQFTYRDPAGNIIESDSVPICYDGEKGEKGDQGTRAPEYRSVGNSDSAITNPVEGDYYLNTTDGAIHKYQNGSWTIITDPDQAITEYNTALADGVRYFSQSTGSLPIVSAMNVWAQNVFAMTAVIQEIFSKNIVIQEGGSITSASFGKKDDNDNYLPAFKLWESGIFECFHGIFRGSIDSGPLYLNNASPAGVTINVNAGTSVNDFYNILMDNGLYAGSHNCSGTLQGYNVSNINMSRSETNDTVQGHVWISEYTSDFRKYQIYEYREYSRYLVKCKIIINNSATLSGEVAIYTIKKTWREQVHSSNRAPDVTYSNYTVGYLGSNASLTFNTSGATMIFRNLPEGSLSSFEAGTVYVDNGYLKIKT